MRSNFIIVVSLTLYIVAGHYTGLTRRQLHRQMPPMFYYLDDMCSEYPIRPLGTDFEKATRAVAHFASVADVVLLVYRKK
jgi:hypothetical protein